MTMTTFSAQRRVDAFWQKVSRGSDCWEWQGGRNPEGYGRFWDGQRAEYAHRFSWALTHGDIPDGMLILHRCDNPPCVNPDHLFIGDQTVNLLDMSAKGRHLAHTKPQRMPRGESHGMHKLTEEAVKDIRAARRTRTIVLDLAQKYGVSVGAIRGVRGRVSWRHV